MDLQSVSDEEGAEEDADEDAGENEDEDGEDRDTRVGPPASGDEHDSEADDGEADERSHLPHRQVDGEAQRSDQPASYAEDADGAVAKNAAAGEDSEDDEVQAASMPNVGAAGPATPQRAPAGGSRGGSSARNVDRAYMDDVAYKPYTRAHPEDLVPFISGKLSDSCGVCVELADVCCDADAASQCTGGQFV